MTDNKYLDYLIVGQGLAGSLLARHLIKAGQKVRVIDKPRPTSASRVAAGLINPVTGKRLVKEEKADVYLQEARACYLELQRELGQPFQFDKAMFRLFTHETIKQAWQKRINDSAYQDYIGESLSSTECGYEDGGFLQKQTGYLATGTLLDGLRDWFLTNDAYIDTTFSYDALSPDEKIHWQGLTARRVIFCEGARVINNPWFKTLPMQPAQGEIMTIQTTASLPNWIINAGKWLLPVAEHRFKLGATYVWPTADKPLDEKITTTAKNELLAALPTLLPGIQDYEIIEHAVGIRPNSLDKRPLIGFHHQYPNLAVFNGFGSKGSMLIPYYARHFADVLLNGTKLDKDVDINRTLP